MPYPNVFFCSSVLDIIDGTYQIYAHKTMLLEQADSMGIELEREKKRKNINNCEKESKSVTSHLLVPHAMSSALY